MQRAARIVLIATLSLAVGVLAACGDSSSNHATGTIDVAVTDAPADSAVALWLTFTSVTLQGVDGSQDQGPFAIPSDRQRVNLMGFTGGEHAVLLTGLDLPEGSYKLRLDADLTFGEIVQTSYVAFRANSPRCDPLPADAVHIEGENTCRYPLEIPSGEQAGFRPKGDITVTAGANSSFTVEFDLRKNVVDPSNPGEIALRLKPTGLRLVNDGEVGGITGAVALPEGCAAADARVYLYDLTGQTGAFAPDDIHDGNASYVTSVPLTEETIGDLTTYSYIIGFIPAGEPYAVALTCDPNDTEEDQAEFPFRTPVTGITVTAGQWELVDLMEPLIPLNP